MLLVLVGIMTQHDSFSCDFFFPVGIHVITEMCLYSLTINSGVFAYDTSIH